MCPHRSARLAHPFARPNQEFRGVFLLGTFVHRGSATSMPVPSTAFVCSRCFRRHLLHDIMHRTFLAPRSLCYSQLMTAQYVTNSNSITTFHITLPPPSPPRHCFSAALTPPPPPPTIPSPAHHKLVYHLVAASPARVTTSPPPSHESRLAHITTYHITLTASAPPPHSNTTTDTATARTFQTPTIQLQHQRRLPRPRRT